MIRPSNRDRALLVQLSKYQVLSTSQIRTLVFSESDYPTTLRRLRQLRGEKILRSLAGLRYGSHAWFLSAKGAGLMDLPKPWQFRNRNTLEHDLTVVELRLALEKAGYGNSWTTEQELKRKAYRPFQSESESNVIPDAVFVESNRGSPRSISLELELNVKAKARYGNILRKYAYRENCGLIWYVVRSRREGERILRVYENLPAYLSKPPLYFSLLDDVLSNPKQAKLFNANGEWVFGEVFEAQERLQNPTALSCKLLVNSEDRKHAA